MKNKMMKKLLLILLCLPLLFSSCKKEEGCTDSIATNYNAEAEEEDGSCIFDILGYWTVTGHRLDTSVVVTINGNIDNTLSGSSSDYESAGLGGIWVEFWSNGLAHGIFSDGMIDTVSYTKTENNLILIFPDNNILEFTFIVDKNNLTLSRIGEQIIEYIPGEVYEYSWTNSFFYNRNIQ